MTSWDVDGRKPQETYKSGRSFVRCVSEVLTGADTCAKNNMGECRMVSECSVALGAVSGLRGWWWVSCVSEVCWGILRRWA